MKNTNKTTSKGMTTPEYLEHLATEEKRSRLLAEIETDPTKKKREKRRSQRIKKLIERVKAMAGAGIETADARKLDKERPGSKTIH